jgi:cytochrome c oxidase subunit 3
VDASTPETTTTAAPPLVVPPLGEQYDSYERQDRTRLFGMWIFLVSELLIFAGLFTLYTAYRAIYGAEFAAGIAHNNATWGTINTLVLITSSFTVAAAVHAVREGRTRACARLLYVSIAIGSLFLVIKGFEYSTHLHEGFAPGRYYSNTKLPQYGARMFFTLYYIATGLHGLHVVAGIGLLAFVAVKAHRLRYDAHHHVGVEMAGLYWHLVDVIWIFLWPVLYLMA